MNIKHRIPWITPFGYTEAEIDTAEDGPTMYDSLAAEAVGMEAAFLAAGGGAHSSSEAPTPYPPPTPYVPPMAQPQARRPAPASAQQTPQACPSCGGPLGPVKQTSKGRVRECTSGCQNDRGYPLSVWLDQRR